MRLQLHSARHPARFRQPAPPSAGTPRVPKSRKRGNSNYSTTNGGPRGVIPNITASSSYYISRAIAFRNVFPWLVEQI